MASTQAKDDAAVRGQTSHLDTRQLLDELDALMDQMLALPIDEQDDGAAPPTASPGPTPTISATLTLVDQPSAPAIDGSSTGSAVEIRPARFDIAAAPARSEPSVANAAAPMPAPMLKDVAAPTPVKLLPPPRHLPCARWRPDHISYQFLLWVNQGYDRGTNWLGKPGRFLRSRAGKALLGIAGLGLLGLAFAWLGKDWLGWNW